MSLPECFAQFARSYATRMGPPIKRLGIPDVQHILAVASGKGGVGKSTSAGMSDAQCLKSLRLAYKYVLGIHCIAVPSNDHLLGCCSKSGCGIGTQRQAEGWTDGRGHLWSLHPPHDETYLASHAWTQVSHMICRYKDRLPACPVWEEHVQARISMMNHMQVFAKAGAIFLCRREAVPLAESWCQMHVHGLPHEGTQFHLCL